jgi:hypothetical protein
VSLIESVRGTVRYGESQPILIAPLFFLLIASRRKMDEFNPFLHEYAARLFAFRIPYDVEL